MIIGIDYGKRKIGIAIADGPLSEPHFVIRVTSFDDAVSKACAVVEKMMPEKVVVGLSEGEMGRESRKFGGAVEALTKIPVVYQDETLTSWQANQMAIEAGKKRAKRRAMEDAYAAALMLQNYLDSR